MLRLRCFWAVFLVLLLGRSDIARAEFTLDLSFSGVGTVLVAVPGGATYFSSPASILVPADDATLVAMSEDAIFDGLPSSLTLPFGQNINLTLDTTFNSVFVRWSGASIPLLTPEDEENAKSPSYLLEGSTGTTQNVTANFSTDLAYAGIATIDFSFDGQNWISATSWNFTGDDGPVPSNTGDTLIGLAWADFVGSIDLDNSNRVELRIIDKVGTEYYDGFDLDVSPTAVPEPSSVVLMAVVAGGLCAARVRRKERGEHAARGVGGGERVGKDGESNAA